MRTTTTVQPHNSRVTTFGRSRFPALARYAGPAGGSDGAGPSFSKPPRRSLPGWFDPPSVPNVRGFRLAARDVGSGLGFARSPATRRAIALRVASYSCGEMAPASRNFRSDSIRPSFAAVSLVRIRRRTHMTRRPPIMVRPMRTPTQSRTRVVSPEEPALGPAAWTAFAARQAVPVIMAMRRSVSTAQAFPEPMASRMGTRSPGTTRVSTSSCPIAASRERMAGSSLTSETGPNLRSVT